MKSSQFSKSWAQKFPKIWNQVPAPYQPVEKHLMCNVGKRTFFYYVLESKVVFDVA